MNSAINPNYVNLMFSPHKAFRMVCWIYMNMSVWIFMNHVCVSEYVRVLSNTIFFLIGTSKRHTIKNTAHGDNIYSMPNGFMLSIGIKRKLHFTTKENTSIHVLICIDSQSEYSIFYSNDRFAFISFDIFLIINFILG